MHSRTLVELAARLVLESIDPPTSAETTAELAKQYWTASKCRLESWQRALRIFNADLKDRDPWHDPWPATEAVVQEILLSELLTRVWSAVLIQRDRVTHSNELTGIAQGVFISHLEVSNQTLRLLMAQGEESRAGVQKLDRLRRRIERWTDLLLGHLPDESIAIRFAHNRTRMQEFARDLRQQPAEVQGQARRILLASLATDLKKNTSRYSANPELNRQIAAGVIAFLPAEQFDSTGVPKSADQVRFEQTPAETDEFLKRFARQADWVETAAENLQRPSDLGRSPFRRRP